jgi:hypothetical protein
VRLDAIESVDGPVHDRLRLLDRLMTLLRRSEYLGLLDPRDTHRPDESWSWLPEVVATMGDRGLPTAVHWRQLARTDEWQHLARDSRGTLDSIAMPASLAGALSSVVQQINDQIEMSPQPAGEWAPVVASLGVSVSSVRRYAGGTRATPQDAAERLHFLALLLADLAGSYNAFGIRRWLNRPRTQLGGRAPAALLGEFDPEGPDAADVARLASSLVGAGAP